MGAAAPVLKEFAVGGERGNDGALSAIDLSSGLPFASLVFVSATVADEGEKGGGHRDPEAGETVEDPADIAAAIGRALDAKAPYLIEVVVSGKP